MPDDEARVHSSAISLNQFAQDLSLCKVEGGNKSIHGLPQATMTMDSSG